MGLYLVTLLRMIQRQGSNCTVKRLKPDGYGGTTDEEQTVLECKGLYHVSTGYLDVTLSTSGEISTRQQPQLLVPYLQEIQQGDYVQISGIGKYVITGVDNVGGLSWCLNLSLGAAR